MEVRGPIFSYEIVIRNRCIFWRNAEMVLNCAAWSLMWDWFWRMGSLVFKGSHAADVFVGDMCLQHHTQKFSVPSVCPDPAVSSVCFLAVSKCSKCFETWTNTYYECIWSVLACFLDPRLSDCVNAGSLQSHRLALDHKFLRSLIINIKSKGTSSFNSIFHVYN